MQQASNSFSAASADHRATAPTAGRPRTGNQPSKVRPLKQKELIRFCRGMASMLKARITTSDALKYYVEDHPDQALRKALLTAKAAIEAGTPLYSALAKTGRFDDKFIGLIQAGSDSGQLHKAFAAIADRQKKEASFKAKLRKATVLPMVIISVLIGLFIVAQLNIVPQVEGLLADVAQEPDPFCDAMFGISHVTKVIWPFVVGGLVTFGVLVWRSAGFRNSLLFLLMSKWRLLKKLIMGMRQMMFLGSLNLMHSNGLTLAQSISTAATSIKGTPFYDEVLEAGRKYMTLGIPFSEAIKKYTSCDHQVSHMIGIGERSSSLDAQLEMLVTMYEEDTDQMMEALTQAMNIIVLLMASILISAVFIGAFLPIFLMGPKMMNGQGL